MGRQADANEPNAGRVVQRLLRRRPFLSPSLQDNRFLAQPQACLPKKCSTGIAVLL